MAFARFRRFVTALARETRTSEEVVLAPTGLIIQPEGTNRDLWCTPVNSTTFAATGGDNVHFGLLRVAEAAAAPVVMTVPMAEQPNLVLADDFVSFLSLGYHVGFFFLEQFVYDWDEAVEIHAGRREKPAARELRLLERLREEFDLQPIANPEALIRAAHDRHAGAIVLPDREEWDRRHGA